MAERTRRRSGDGVRAPRSAAVAALTHRLLDRLSAWRTRLLTTEPAASPRWTSHVPLALVVGIPVIHWTGVSWAALVGESLGLASFICSCSAPLAGIALLLALSTRIARGGDGPCGSDPAAGVVTASATRQDQPLRDRRAPRRPSPGATTAGVVHRGGRLDHALAVVERRGLYDWFADAAAA